ncbi:Outer membrane porin F [Campylobacter majalis]|uniref:Outer membrane porin F n=1 Tax=Campylobacter majalis TaxID=2790656 RepID=A0ABN7KAQ1_9BACT|nr:OmpA family protein [Campylobacter majalis]CAD7287842.1 Outer membrane porin F [Campylobacter majalis]
MKKIAIALVAASSLFAVDAAYNYEVTPTIGGVRTEGNLDFNRDQLNLGLNVAKNLEGVFIDQIQLGVDYVRKARETVDGTTRNGRALRYHIDAVKNIFDFTDNLGLYGLVGVGYEDLSSTFVANEDGGFGQYGLGLRYQVAENFALKLEARDAIKFEHADHNFFYTLGFGIGLGAKNVAPVVVAAPAVAEAPVSLDDDNDGVVNELDRCPNTPAGVVVDEHGCEKVIVLRDLGVNFAFDSYKVSDAYAKEIKKVADFMSENPDYRVVLAGHTDSVGKEAYNQKLSEKRANAVAETLKGYGVDADKISTVGYGELRPVADNKTKEGRALNRRVEATFSK